MRWFRLLCVLPLVPGLVGCGALKDDKKAATEPNPFGPTGIPPGLRGGGEQGTPVAPGGNAAVLERHVNPEDIVWTDADDPDAEIPDLSGLLQEATKDGVWAESETSVRRESKKTGKPLLIWFTDGARSVECKNLDAELFIRDDFEKWADANVIRLRVDQNVGGVGSIIKGEPAEKREYVRKLKERYKVRGYPSLLMVAPSGEVVGRYKGYRKGRSEFLWGQLKQSAGVAADNHKRWVASLEKKGYREWSDGKGRSIFARLVSYRDGELFLVEPDGQRFRTHEKRLSAGDQEWIRQEKEKRGMQ